MLPLRGLVPHPACGGGLGFRLRPAWHMAYGMGCGGWREQWELRLQPAGDTIISRFILPLSSFCAAKCDPLYYTLDTDQACRMPMGERGLIWDLGRVCELRPAPAACSSALSLLGAPFWVLHRNFDKSFDDLVQDTNWVRISRNLGSLAT